MAVIGALALAFTTTAFAQAASDATTTTKKQKGTTLHQQNKAHKLKGASAAAAASSLGTNDKASRSKLRIAPVVKNGRFELTPQSWTVIRLVP